MHAPSLVGGREYRKRTVSATQSEPGAELRSFRDGGVVDRMLAPAVEGYVAAVLIVAELVAL
jgi:hypothetical protein